MRGKTLVSKKIYQLKLCQDVSTVLFFAAFLLHELSVIIDTSMWTYSANEEMMPMGFFAKMIRFMAYGLMLIKILYDCRIENRNIFYIYAVIGIIGLSFICCRNTAIVFYLLIMIATIGISDRTVLVSSMIAQCFVLFTTVGFSMAGVIENAVSTDKGRVREFLGFGWATNAPILFFFIVLQFIYLKKGRISLINAGVIILLDCFFFVRTDSKAVFAITIAVAVFFFLFGSFMEKGSITSALKWLIIALPWILAGITIYIHKIYNKNNSLLVKLNIFLSYRLSLGNKAINRYGIHLFGTRIKWIGHSVREAMVTEEYNYVDCSYLKVLLEYGLAFLVLMLIIYSAILYKAFKNKMYYAVWVVVFILLFGTTEPMLFNLVFNPFILLAFAAMTSLPKKKD